MSEKREVTKDEIFGFIRECVQDFSPEKNLTDTLLISDMVSDSLEIVEVRIDLEEHYGISIADEEMYKIELVKDLIQLVGEKYSGRIS